MEQPEEQIQIISEDILAIIPKFNGDQNLVTSFIKKVEYVLSNFQGPKNEKQETYVFHAITSRLCGRAAALLSDTDDITNWEQLKEVLNQHFGDPRTEESLAIELENLKIHFNESYLEFYRRILQIRSSLLSKLNQLGNDKAKVEKKIIYNNLAFKVFLNNLTEDLIRTVKVMGSDTIEKALKVVMEEMNLQIQNKARFKEGFPKIGIKSQTPWNKYFNSQRRAVWGYTSNKNTFWTKSDAFGQQQQTGTAHVKYDPVVGTDVSKWGTDLSVKQHCITCMKEYKNKSLEELRLEDYMAGRYILRTDNELCAGVLSNLTL